MGAGNSTNFSQHYKSNKVIGVGTFAVVKHCVRKSDQQPFAVKVVDKTKLTPTEVRNLQTEISILQSLRHPNIIGIIDVFQNEQKVKIVLELCQERSLAHEIDENGSKGLPQNYCARVVYEMARCIEFLHQHHVVHRDLKPENVLFDQRSGAVKLADFGSAKQIDAKQNCIKNKKSAQLNLSAFLMNTKMGTPLYVAPEMLTDKHYTYKVDLWSLGCILYISLCGYHPFSSRKLDKMYQNIMKGAFDFESATWNAVDDHAKDLVNALLCVDPKERLKVEQVLHHQWIGKYVTHITPSVSYTPTPSPRMKAKVPPSGNLLAVPH